MSSAWSPEVRALRSQLASLVSGPEDLAAPAIRRVLERLRAVSETDVRQSWGAPGPLPHARIFGRMALMRSLCQEGQEMGQIPIDPPDREAAWHLLQASGTVSQQADGQWTVLRRPSPAELALCESLLNQLQFVHQPVIDLKTGATVGYEAFVRGPQNSPVESPEHLAQAFRSRGLLEQLERRCREAAVREGQDFRAGEKLFLNVDLAVADRHPVVLPAGLLPHDVVLEVSAERRADWRRERVSVLKAWQQEGFHVIVDNLSLTHGARLLGDFIPDGIKLDRSVIGDLHRHPRRQSTVARMVQQLPGLTLGWFASGIENPAELSAVKGTGVRYGQGFLLGRPAPQLL